MFFVRKRIFCALFFISFKAAISQTLNFNWVDQFGGKSGSFANSMSNCTDLTGNIYACGCFQDSIDFDPGPGKLKLYTGTFGGYIIKLNSNGNLLWVKALQGNRSTPMSICMDPTGDILVVGQFKDTVDFDPGPGTYSLVSSPSGKHNIFILKLNSNGNFVWAKAIDATANSNGVSVTCDKNSNIYFTGQFCGISDFDPSPSTYTLIAKSCDGFVCKLNAGGNLTWAAQFENQNYQNGMGYSLINDSLSNIYVTGSFGGNVDFDPGPGISLLSAFVQDGFICKLDSNGTHIWSKQIGGGGTTEGYGIKISKTNKLFITGHYGSTCDFDPGPGTSTLTSSTNDIFILSLDTTGNFNWVKGINGSGFDYGRSLILHPNTASGHIYMTGSFMNSCNFDPGSSNLTLTSAGAEDIFITKFDFLGNFLWAKKMGGPGTDIPYHLEVDPTGNLITSGLFSGYCDFDPEPGLYNLNSLGTDAFIHKSCDGCITTLTFNSDRS
jgi:hypothetical protein